MSDEEHATALGHCKDAPHLRIIAVHGVGHGDADQTFSELLEMACVNTQPEVNPWGAGIAPVSGRQGMRFLPGGVLYLAQWLPLGAIDAQELGSDGVVALQHTFQKVLRTWRFFEPETADKIGAAAQALCDEHGLAA